MHPKLRVFVITALTLFTAGVTPASAAPPTDACAVLTTAQVSSALGSAVGDGAYIMPSFKETCTWTIPTGGAVTFALQKLAFFNAGKGAMASAERTMASGVGDEAYYIGVGPTVGLAVRKGSGAFKVSVYNSSLSLDQRKDIEKKLALEALSKF